MTAHAAASPSSPCLIWPRARDTHGRGNLFHKGKSYQVHRIVCEQVNGPPPFPKAEAAHLCNNGRGGCVEPSHLKWMTRAENAAMRLDQRYGRKLTEEQVRDIRAWATLVKEKTWIARRYNVSLRLVSQILKGDRWWWLT